MRRLLLLAAMSLATTILFVAPAAATQPQDVTITIAEVFHANGPCTGDITASGGVFGESTHGLDGAPELQPGLGIVGVTDLSAAPNCSSTRLSTGTPSLAAPS